MFKTAQPLRLAGLTLFALWLMMVIAGCSDNSEQPKTTTSCERGTQGCGCEDGTTCKLSSAGQQLACVLGTCALPSCTPGAAGCACDEGACGAGLECSSASGVERCEVTGCQVGELHCGCALDRSCAAGAVCQGGRCEQLSCQLGAKGCACAQNYACATSLSCETTTSTCQEAGACQPGQVGCACLAGGACSGDAVCQAGLCQDASCSPGREGCACLDDACGVNQDGEQLLCQESVCQAPTCAPGATGCVCKLGKDCDGETDTCVDGFCKPNGCIAGTKDCECLLGGCDPGLTCQNGTICLDNTGLKGGACKADGTCEQALRCDRSVLPAQCVRCELGSQGCQCKEDDTCNPGMACQMGHCVGDETVLNRTAPSEIFCKTPCKDGLVEDDRYCVNGYMEGCLDGQTCDKGSCVDAVDGQAKLCMEDSDCAEHQLCYSGYCHSNCQSDNDCTDADQPACYKHVCRAACTLSAGGCGRGQTCEATDGENGYCVTAPSDFAATPSAPPATGSVSVDKTLIEFSNTSFSTVVTLNNDTDQYVTFTVTKVEHDVLLSDKSQDIKRDYDDASTCTGATCPLWWVEMGEFGSIAADRKLTVRAAPKCGESCPKLTVRVANSGKAIDAVRWRGAIKVDSSAGAERIDLSYVASPEGHWVGQMHYFANFEDDGIDTVGVVQGWLDRADKDNVSGVRNGLIQRWGAFRNGDISGGWDEMKAVLNATSTGQWAWPTVVNSCVASNGACYLYDSVLPRFYVTALNDAPIPDGVSQFPMAMNIHIPDGTKPAQYKGRIVSDRAFHYAGNPAVTINFNGDPSDTATCDPEVIGNCVNFIEDLDVKLSVGGRYEASAGVTQCSAGFELTTYPWLVPGFLEDATLDSGTGLYRKRACVDARLPYFGTMDDDELAINKNLARSNPIPDGKVLKRTVELLDGAMIDQSELFLLFRERYPSFIDPSEEMVAYGYILLSREPSEIVEDDDNGNGTPDAYEGSAPPSTISDANVNTQAQCSADLLKKILGNNTSLTQSNAGQVITALIEGGTPPASSQLVPGASEEVHYVCHETGLFNGGSGHSSDWGAGNNGPNYDSCVTSANGVCEDGGARSSASSCAIGTDVTDCGYRYTDTRVECPLKSNVTFFTTKAASLPNIHLDACNNDGSCMDRLNTWISNGAAALLQVDPSWTCQGAEAFCDDNPLDRRTGKVFYKQASGALHFLPLRAQMNEAFRYKTRFRSRSGSSLGFVPTICVPYSTTTPYCYAPEDIDGLRERVDCLMHIYDRFYDSAAGSNNSNADKLYSYLEENFSLREEPNPLGGQPTSYDGFERLYAELLIMLGDDAYTSAFESRFDLAGSLAASFEGDLFERDGIRLSGIAGFEIYKLYQAVQYYDLVLNRFYKLGPVLGASLKSGPTQTDRNFVSAATVTSYFDRLIRASTQRSRAQSEIARRYQNLNRPDLAKAVAQRAYTSTYLESVVLANLITGLYEVSGGSDRPQILNALKQSQRRYSMALLDLAEVQKSITEDVNFFGYPADYIPFPTLDASTTISAESNAFEKVLRSTQAKLDIARNREDKALSQVRTYETDEASFQAELTRISRNYESQLGDICGTFAAPDGLIYPSVERYAYLDDRLSVIGDPCGFVQNGQIYQALGEVNLRQLEIRQIAAQMQATYDRVYIEKARVEQQCDLTLSIADYNYRIGNKLFNLDEDIRTAQYLTDSVVRTANLADKMVQTAACTSVASCAVAGIKIASTGIAGIVTETAIGANQIYSQIRREERNDIELNSAKWNTQQQCNAALIDSNATMESMMLGIRDLELSMLAADYKLRLAISAVVKLRQQAQRLHMEWDEALEMSVNTEAAKNDPNIRIYRNDSVINADLSFQDALRSAYRLTKVYEYYTSTSYAKRDQLFLIRMVGSGDYNLENYITDIKNAFDLFEESFGLPEDRLEIISLRDDILQVPKLNGELASLSVDDRIVLLRQFLNDPALLNAKGYLTIPLSTSIKRLSPLTRNHKINYIEATIEGNSLGDQLGRLYLRQVGTSMIRSVDDINQYYRFPERTAVINPFFYNTRQFPESPELYRSFRMKDRPLVNTAWELIFNQRDEAVNQDIGINNITDIKLYVHYTDFTVY